MLRQRRRTARSPGPIALAISSSRLFERWLTSRQKSLGDGRRPDRFADGCPRRATRLPGVRAAGGHSWSVRSKKGDSHFGDRHRRALGVRLPRRQRDPSRRPPPGGGQGRSRSRPSPAATRREGLKCQELPPCPLAPIPPSDVQAERIPQPDVSLIVLAPSVTNPKSASAGLPESAGNPRPAPVPFRSILCSGTARAVRYYRRKTGRLAPLRYNENALNNPKVSGIGLAPCRSLIPRRPACLDVLEPKERHGIMLSPALVR